MTLIDNTQELSYQINRREVSYDEWLFSREDGVYQISYQGHIEGRTWFKGRCIGELNEILKSKGRLWLLMTFGEVVWMP